jgi:predicted kinase
VAPDELLLLTGAPGCGKTTVAPLVADRAPLSACLDLDWFFAKLRRGAIEPWKGESHQQNRTVLAAAAAALAAFSAGGYFTVAEGILYPFMLDLFIDSCQPLSVRLSYAVLVAPLSVVQQRVRDRISEPEHFGALADEHVVEALWHQFEDPNVGIEARHRIDIDGLSPREVADKVFRRHEDGTLRL